MAPDGPPAPDSDWTAGGEGLHEARDLIEAHVPGSLSFFGRAREQSAPVTRIEPGKVIDDFRLVAPIGQGGMGQVWEAEQVSLKRRVALKLVRPDRVSGHTLDLFAREARAGGRLHHPGIVAVHGHGEHEAIAWISMELVEGSWTLRDFLDDAGREDELPAGYYHGVAVFLAELADSMQVAHEAGVIHRDLKPRNVLITPDEHPKVSDFGLAKITDETAISQTGEFAGTYYYMSPEQAMARRMGLDNRTDIFSLGVVMYEMLALRRPFEGDTTQQIARQIVMEEAVDPRRLRSRVPRDLAVISGKCMEKHPDRRYQTMAELAADIRRHVADEPIVARPPTWWQRAVKWVRRHPTPSVAAGVGSAALVVISVLLLETVRARNELKTTNAALSTEQANLALTNAALSTEQANLALANEDLEAERASLARANESLEAERANLARANESLESEIASVKRLSALQDYDELITRVDGLWPPHPQNIEACREWMVEAQALVDELALHYAKRDELRAEALPVAAEEREAQREGHPDYPRLQALPGEIASRRRALRERRDGVRAEPADVDWAELPGNARGLNDLAWDLVKPDREVFGREAEGLVLADRALELAQAARDDALVASVGNTLSRALFAVGRDEEALEASREALEVVTADKREEYEGYLSDLEGWVEKARGEEGLRGAQEELARLEGERVKLEAAVDERQVWRFADTEEGREASWWHGNLTKLVEALEGLGDPQTGLLSEGEKAVSAEHGWSVPRRLAFAERVRDGLAVAGEWKGRWQEATAAIRTHGAYGGLVLAPQVGLVPIGTDTASGLWEFWHVATGEEPLRGEDGKLVLTEETGLVLVLIPGGTFWMGATADPDAPHNVDPGAEGDEGPVHEVTLSAYFLSKYEMTQGQWLRFTGRNPSFYRPPSNLVLSLMHPVEQVRWIDCMRELPRMGLGLPSEAQWENGCRAGTETPWWTGGERDSLRERKAANLADQAAARAGARWPEIKDWPELDDGYAVHAPVGTYAANGLGLHEVHGNVWEWCLDGYDGAFYGRSPDMDPVAPYARAASRVYRGGSFSIRAVYARSAIRINDPPVRAASDLGVRPARVASE